MKIESPETAKCRKNVSSGAPSSAELLPKNNSTQKMDTNKIAVTIVLGCKSSGKTTFINSLAKHCKTESIAVIETSKGEVAVDQALIQDHISLELNHQFLKKTGTCKCCDLQGKFRETLVNIASTQQHNRLFVEVNDANSEIEVGSLLCMFSEVELSPLFFIDCVIAVVDISNFYDLEGLKRKSQNSKFFLDGLAFADRIVLNKIDLLKESNSVALEKVEAVAANVNPCAKIFQLKHGKIDPKQFINVHSMSIKDLGRVIQELQLSDSLFDRSGTPTPSMHNSVQISSPNTSSSSIKRRKLSISPEVNKGSKITTIHLNAQLKKHDHSELSYIGIRCEGVFHRHRFEQFLGELFEQYNYSIFRIKGCVHFSQSLDIPTIIQSIYHRFTYGVASDESLHLNYNSENQENLITISGYGLDLNKIVKLLEQTLYKPHEAEIEDEQLYYVEDDEEQ